MKKKTKIVKISPQQAKLIDQCNAEVQKAQMVVAEMQSRLNLVLAGVLAGHGLSEVPVIGLNTDTNTLTVKVG
jgi:hypothetical protein